MRQFFNMNRLPERTLRIVARFGNRIVVFFSFVYFLIPLQEAKTQSLGKDIPDNVNLIVEFTGRSTAADVLRLVNSMRAAFGDEVVPSESIIAQKGDTACDLLRESLKLPGCPEGAVRATFEAFNGLTARTIYAGKVYKIPKIEVETFLYTTVVDDRELSAKSDGLVKSSEILKEPSWQPFVNDTRRSADDPHQSWVELKGISLHFRFGSSDTATDAISHFFALNLQSATLHTDVQAHSKGRFSVHYVAPRQQFDSCPMTDGQEGAYWHLLDWLAEWQVPQCTVTCNSSNRCPQIVLVDQTVHPHVDLVQRLTHVDLSGKKQQYKRPDYCADPRLSEKTKHCQFSEFLRRCHHGTSMASVIASAHNGRGFAGLSPANEIVSFDWNTASTDHLIRLIRERSAIGFEETNGPQIYLFASKFPNPVASVRGETDANDFATPSYAKAYVNQWFELRDPAVRTRMGLTKSVVNARQLWVVAAGQPDQAKERDAADPVRLHRRSPFAPMNLGDQENVIVVTACENCAWPVAKIYEGANFADRGDSEFVTIAAPGFGYLTPTEDTYYADEHGGTSQAAAFVAGVAAGMVNCAPEFYIEPAWNRVRAAALKKRLVLSSRPVLANGDASRASPGIIDPRAALLDPARDWHLKRPQFQEKDYKGSTLGPWCTERIEFYKDDGDRGSVSAKNTLRIRAVPSEYWRDSQRRWYIYSSIRGPSQRAAISVAGPVLFDRAFEERALIRRATGDPLKLGEIDDLLLSSHKAVALQCN